MDKLSKLSYAKSIDAEKKTVTGYASTFGWDRDGERFVKGAWNLADYMKNPVVLWSHDISSLPIAKAVAITEDEKGLRFEAQFIASDPRSMQIFKLFQEGFLNAFSVGFIRQDFVMEDMNDGSGQKGLAITKVELYEFSAVSVPANPGALASRELAELAVKCIGPEVIERLDTKAMGEQFLIISPDPEKPEPERRQDPERGQDDLEPALKRIQELAKVAKSKPLDETNRSLVATTMAVLAEMLETGKKDELTPEDLKSLAVSLGDFAKVVATVNPESAHALLKTISQIEKALAGRAA